MRTLMYIGGGAMRGAYGAGVMIALHQLGLGDVFDTVIGASTGAPSAAYFLAGEEFTRRGATIYYEECARDFIRWSRVRKPIDIERVMGVFKQGAKSLPVDRVRASRSEFYVLATNCKTGHTEMLNAKQAQPDMFAAINASIAMPAVSTPVSVNGQEYIDGDIDPLPSPLIMETFKPTDVLIVPNRQARSLRNLMGKLDDVGLSMATWRHRNPGLTERALIRSRRFWLGVQYFVSAPEVTVGIIWPPHAQTIRTFMTDAGRLKSACREAERETYQMFGQS